MTRYLVCWNITHACTHVTSPRKTSYTYFIETRHVPSSNSVNKYPVTISCYSEYYWYLKSTSVLHRQRRLVDKPQNVSTMGSWAHYLVSSLHREIVIWSDNYFTCAMYGTWKDQIIISFRCRMCKIVTGPLLRIAIKVKKIPINF